MKPARTAAALVSFAALATLASAVAGVTLAFAPACSSSSSAPCVPQGTVTVQVTDEDVDNPSNYLCDATVTIAGAGGTGGTPTPLKPQGTDGSVASCVYTINEGPGTYTLSASASGYVSASQTLKVTDVSCVTESVQVRIQLYETQMGTGGEGGEEAGLPDVSVFRTPDGGLPDAADDVRG